MGELEKSYFEYTENKSVRNTYHVEMFFEFKERKYIQAGGSGYNIRSIDSKWLRPKEYTNGKFVFFEFDYPSFLFDAGFIPDEIREDSLYTKYIYRITYKDYIAHSPRAAIKHVHGAGGMETFETIDEKQLIDYDRKVFKDIKAARKNNYNLMEHIYLLVGDAKKERRRNSSGYIIDIAQVSIKDGIISIWLHDRHMEMPEYKKIKNTFKPDRKETERGSTWYLFCISFDQLKGLGFKYGFYHIETEYQRGLELVTQIEKIMP